MDTTMQPSRRRGGCRRAALITAGAVVVLIVIAVAAGGGGKSTPASVPSTSGPPATAPAPQVTADVNGATCAPGDMTDGFCPGDSPSPVPPTTVTFVVTGAGDPSITYGSDSDNRDGGGHLGTLGDGNALPWKRSLSFNGDSLYYSVSAQLEGSGDISCKIIVSGPGDNPTTVASGHASGGYNICSAQAAPSDSSGTSWQQEG